MYMDNPNHIPASDYIANDDGSYYCNDFKVKSFNASIKKHRQ